MKPRELSVPFFPDKRCMGVSPGYIPSGGLLVTFMCRACNTAQPTKGRKKRYRGRVQQGWTCAGCLAQRAASK